MQFDIRNRYTGAVQFTAEIDCAEDAPASVKIGLAVIWAARTGADLRVADLRGADLRGADLSGADLRGADLRVADLRGAKDIPYFVSAQTVIVPEGQIVGWKKCRANVIVKLTIPAEARRSNATGRKCRAEYAEVAEVIGADVGISMHDGRTEYRVGQRVTCHKWCDDRWEECAGGIHFFITRDEAEDY